jgi:serine/threonine protein kinase
MELVEGPTLDELIERQALGAGLSAIGKQEQSESPGSGSAPKSKAPSLRPTRGLPLDEAFRIARQIAEALEAAHEQGIDRRRAAATEEIPASSVAAAQRLLLHVIRLFQQLFECLAMSRKKQMILVTPGGML